MKFKIKFRMILMVKISFISVVYATILSFKSFKWESSKKVHNCHWSYLKLIPGFLACFNWNWYDQRVGEVEGRRFIIRDLQGQVQNLQEKNIKKNSLIRYILVTKQVQNFIKNIKKNILPLPALLGKPQKKLFS